jgi:hypothetical protein
MHPFYVFYRPITARGVVVTTEYAVRLSTFLASR